MILQCIKLFRNSLEYKIEDRKNDETKKSKRKKKLSTNVFSFIQLCNRSCEYSLFLWQIVYIASCDSSVLLAASFKLIRFVGSHKLIAMQIFYLNIWIFKKWSMKKSLQRNLRTNSQGEPFRQKFWKFIRSVPTTVAPS